ncbi:hypothetical protein L798_11946 [Zootermopsis nevadensis]|uniref:Uncharacterized protein n=1 Tax=Zootermopsis nevadensis TaxID=136037 RepID=A0A067R7R5_ZOONE|nr:hypothetical protein L798_11946 [Zootermopsis nevadensis]
MWSVSCPSDSCPVCLQYRAVRAVTWRHIYSPYSGSGHRACFYAGSVLDEFLSFLLLARHSPTHLGFFMLNPTTGNEIMKLIIRCSKFMNHFEIRTYNFRRNYFICDAKINDLCHRLRKTYFLVIPHEQAVTVNGTECHIKTHYSFRTWLLVCQWSEKDQICRDRTLTGVD